MDRLRSVLTQTCSPALAILLSACAQYQWQKYGATQIDFDRDKYECQTEAARTYPPLLVTRQIIQGYATASTTNCSGTGSAYGSSGYAFGNSNVTCTTTPGQNVPGYSTTDDANAGNRSQAAKQCMYARGWQLVQVK